MLMFLGEYFKYSIGLCDEIYDKNKEAVLKGAKNETQDSFFITNDIINLLGIACKKILEGER